MKSYGVPFGHEIESPRSGTVIFRFSLFIFHFPAEFPFCQMPVKIAILVLQFPVIPFIIVLI